MLLTNKIVSKIYIEKVSLAQIIVYSCSYMSDGRYRLECCINTIIFTSIHLIKLSKQYQSGVGEDLINVSMVRRTGFSDLEWPDHLQTISVWISVQMLLVTVVVVVAVVEVVPALPAPAVLVWIAEPEPHRSL